MLNSTLCYLERGDEYLMLHRVKKKNDLNHDKWIGVGGKCEEGESPEDCVLRETREEPGLTLTDSSGPAGGGRTLFLAETAIPGGDAGWSVAGRTAPDGLRRLLEWTERYCCSDLRTCPPFWR